MIKGVNKQVLEISETDNGFFEKAIFFVKPEFSGLSEGKLRECADMEFKNKDKPPRQKEISTKSKVRAALIGVGIFICGVVVGAIFTAM
ncbi:MAG: hypothetical protein ACI4IF_02910 [Acutalibacteraceae bacterium]